MAELVKCSIWFTSGEWYEDSTIPTLESAADELAVVVVEEGARRVVICGVNEDGSPYIQRWNPERYFSTLAQALEAAAKSQRQYADKQTALAEQLEALAKEANRRANGNGKGRKTG